MTTHGDFLMRAYARAERARKVGSKSVKRQLDERLLEMLRDVQSMTTIEVAAKFQTTANSVRVLTAKVRRDDLQFSGEPREVVLKGYGR